MNNFSDKPTPHYPKKENPKNIWVYLILWIIVIAFWIFLLKDTFESIIELFSN